MADRLSERISNSETDSDSDSGDDPTRIICWLRDDGPEIDPEESTLELTEELADAEDTTPEEIERQAEEIGIAPPEEASRVEQTRQAVMEVHQLDDRYGDRPRRLVVKLEDGVYNLYLQVKKTEDTDRGLVNRWKAKRLISAGNAENPLL